MKLSIIIPTYNAQQTLIRCIESIVLQNDLLLQIIIVDDGSIDDTVNIARGLQQKYHNIVVLAQQNSGPSFARMVGLSYASGDYVTFIDADDFLDEHAYEELYSILERTHVDLLEFGYKYVTANGLTLSVSHKPEILLENKKIYEQFVVSSNRTNSLWNKICKRKLLYNVNFPNYKMGEDLCVNLQIMYNARSYIYVDIPYYNYVQSPKGLTGTKDLKSYQDDIESGIYFYTFTKKRAEELVKYPLFYLLGKLIDADIFVSKKFGIDSKQHKKLSRQFNDYFSLINFHDRHKKDKLCWKFYIYKYLGVYCCSFMVMASRNIINYFKHMQFLLQK